MNEILQIMCVCTASTCYRTPGFRSLIGFNQCINGYFRLMYGYCYLLEAQIPLHKRVQLSHVRYISLLDQQLPLHIKILLSHVWVYITPGSHQLMHTMVKKSLVRVSFTQYVHSTPHRLPITDYRLPTIDYRPPITSQKLFEIWYSIKLIEAPPSVDYHLPLTTYRLPTTDYRLPITDYRLPFTDYRLPTTCLPPDRGEPPAAMFCVLHGGGSGEGLWCGM